MYMWICKSVVILKCRKRGKRRDVYMWHPLTSKCSIRAGYYVLCTMLCCLDVRDCVAADGEAHDLPVQRDASSVPAVSAGRGPARRALRRHEPVVRRRRHPLHPRQLLFPRPHAPGTITLAPSPITPGTITITPCPITHQVTSH